MSLTPGVRALLLLLLIQGGSWQPIGVSSAPYKVNLAAEDQFSYLAVVRAPGLLCTGAIISVKTILVGEKCTVFDDETQNSSPFPPEKVEVAYNKVNVPMAFQPVEKVLSPPTEGRDLRHSDIALLIMKDPVPGYISIAAIPAPYLQYPLGKTVYLARRGRSLQVRGHPRNYLKYEEMDITRPETCFHAEQEPHFSSFCLERKHENVCPGMVQDIAVMEAEDGSHVVLGVSYFTGVSSISPYQCLAKGSKSSNFTDWILRKGVGPFKIYNGKNDWAYSF